MTGSLVYLLLFLTSKYFILIVLYNFNLIFIVQTFFILIYNILLNFIIIIRLWTECCSSYAKQLIEKHSAEGQGLKAASYLLAIHKVEEAVDCLIACKLPKEAVIFCLSVIL